MTLLILVALTLSAPGQVELVKASLPPGQTQGMVVQGTDRAHVEIAVRQVRRHVQDFKGQVARRSLPGREALAMVAGEFRTPGLSPRLLRSGLLSLPPPAIL